MNTTNKKNLKKVIASEKTFLQHSQYVIFIYSALLLISHFNITVKRLEYESPGAWVKVQPNRLVLLPTGQQ